MSREPSPGHGPTGGNRRRSAAGRRRAARPIRRANGSVTSKRRRRTGTTPSRHNPRMRLNAWLARAGVASRRKADELIKAGRVTVNGAPGRLNTFVQADDDVRLDGD